MSDPAPIGSYIPLRGDELKKVAIQLFTDMLGDYPAWSASIAHINPRFTITLHLETHPYDPGRKLDLEKSLRKQTHREDPPAENTDIPKVVKTLELDVAITGADEAREKAGLLVPTKQLTEDGQMADYAEDPFGKFDPGQGGPQGADSSSEGSSS